MASYAYRCPHCEEEFTADYPMGRASEFETCPVCHSQSRRQLPMPYVAYKARGFTGAGRHGEGRIDHFRNANGSPLTEADKHRVPDHHLKDAE